MEIFKGRDLTPPSVELRVEIPAMTLTIEHKKISLTTLVFIVLAIARILLKHISAINEMLVEE